MHEYRQLFENNRAWVARMTKDDPEYFANLSKGQAPQYLYIGCSDSRAPANSMTGTKPGELFVHRNIANQVFPSDLNVLAVIQYAVEVLDVKHIIVSGHYGCGGVKAAMGDTKNGLVDNWLGSLRGMYRLHRDELAALPEAERTNRLVELNVIEQVHHLSLIPTIRDAWKRGRRPILHGLVLELATGHLREIVSGIDGPDAVAEKLQHSAFVPSSSG